MRNKAKKTNGPATAGTQLRFTHPSATRVCVAGTFNDWRPDSTSLVALGEGRWATELVLPPGNYEYCLVVDGAWMPDPAAAETVPNPFGGRNSVLKVPPVAT